MEKSIARGSVGRAVAYYSRGPRFVYMLIIPKHAYDWLKW